ncbi:MAG: IS110 family transposase [Deltaproteobacteria bacterium]|jgi:transposase|nr:IS110 family transposase [Deltaproteobacteria bacterium]
MKRAYYYVGLDIAKNIFQIFAADGRGREIGNKKILRKPMIEFFANLSPCVIGIEACGTAHYWARTLEKMGHRVRLIQPQRVKTFLGYRNKTDAADARAICEALMHPGTRFVRIKSVEQQDTDHLLAQRERLVHNRTQVVNQTRSFLAERGIVVPQGIHQFEKGIRQILAQHWEEFSDDFQSVVTENFAEYEELTEKIDRMDARINARVARTEECKRLMQISGIGPLTATALIAHVGDARQFKNGRQMAAYLGITPREHSSGGKQRLLGITKRGNVRLRTLLVLAARAAMHGIERRKRDENGQPLRLSALESWILTIKERRGTFKAAVALANKLARIAWAVLAKGEVFQPVKACSVSVAA